MNGTAEKTSGGTGLTRSDLKYNKSGRIVSKVKSEQGTRAFRANGLEPASREFLAKIRPRK